MSIGIKRLEGGKFFLFSGGNSNGEKIKNHPTLIDLLRFINSPDLDTDIYKDFLEALEKSRLSLNIAILSARALLSELFNKGGVINDSRNFVYPMNLGNKISSDISTQNLKRLIGRLERDKAEELESIVNTNQDLQSNKLEVVVLPPHFPQFTEFDSPMLPTFFQVIKKPVSDVLRQNSDPDLNVSISAPLVVRAEYMSFLNNERLSVEKVTESGV